jgi:hypothetical protein
MQRKDTKMNRISIALAIAALTACAGAEETATTTTGTTTTSGTTQTTPATFSSAFISGQYSIDSFSLLPTTADGMDLNGDGVPDNSLPGTLMLLDTMVDQDLSVDGFNTQVGEAFASGEAITLADALFEEGLLSIQMLTGMNDGSGLSVDPASYDSNGDSISLLLGGFTDEEAFATTSDMILLSFPFLPKTAPLPLVFEMVSFDGDINEAGMSGTLYGVIPTDRLIEEVITPLVPKKGVEGMTYEEVMGLVVSILGYPTVSDVTFEDGRVGISAAFTYTATATSF